MLIRLIISFVVCGAAALLGSFFTSVSLGDWYDALKKPAFIPPPEYFTIVWLILYTLMALALFLAWQKKAQGKRVGGALMLFFIQLVLNILWSVCFFVLRSPAYALIDMGLLIFFTLLTIFAFDRLSKLAAFLLLPYLFWLGFAAFLNISILKLNP